MKENLSNAYVDRYIDRNVQFYTICSLFSYDNYSLSSKYSTESNPEEENNTIFKKILWTL